MKKRYTLKENIVSAVIGGAIIIALSPYILHAQEEQRKACEVKVENVGNVHEVENYMPEKSIQETQATEITEITAELPNEELTEEAKQPEITEEMYNLIYYVSKVIHGEAGICDNTEKYWVATIFMNRLERSDFPNNPEEVLKRGYACYKDHNWNYEEPTQAEKDIAYDVVVNGVRICDITVVYQSKSVEGLLEEDGKVVYESKWHQYGTKRYNP